MVDGKSSSVWSVEEDAELARLQVLFFFFTLTPSFCLCFFFFNPFSRTGFLLLVLGCLWGGGEERGKKIKWQRRPLPLLSRCDGSAASKCIHKHTRHRTERLMTRVLSPTPIFFPQEIHGNRWALVAAELPGKTGQQCAQRWRHKVNPSIRKDKWTEDEDVLVRAAALVARRLRRNTTT